MAMADKLFVSVSQHQVLLCPYFGGRFDQKPAICPVKTFLLIHFPVILLQPVVKSFN